MKKAYYYTSFPITKNVYLYYNAYTNNYLFMSNNRHSIYQNNSPEEIKEVDKELYNLLIDSGFIEADEVDEQSIIEFKKLQLKMDKSQYNVVINTTLDCNLNCWYCYESKIEGSDLKENILEIIKKNIQQKYMDSPYKELKMSFFGGEPLKNFRVVKEILIFCKNFTEDNKISLIADFTTNSTLITNDILSFLKDFKCQFQITLDGDEKRHNEIRFFKHSEKGTYKLVVNNIYKIEKLIPHCKTWIRINFDDKTLMGFQKILDDLSLLDRTRNHLILRKVWQFPMRNINKDLILNALQMAMDRGFTIDYYTLPIYNLCFADRENEVLFNYDGKVFKCSTLESFDEEHVEGKVNEETGKVEWNINKISKKMLQRSPDRCLKCKIFPVCLGPCSKNSTQGDNFSCMVDEIGLSMDEFIFFCFKQEQNQKKIFKEIEV